MVEAQEDKNINEKNQGQNVDEKDVAKKEKLKHSVSGSVLIGGLIVVLVFSFFAMGTIFVTHQKFETRSENINHMRIGKGFGNMESFGSVGRPGMMRGYGVRQNQIVGKVTGINGKTFTIDASGTSYSVQINDNTRFPIDSATTVKAGDSVYISGQKDSNGIIQATQIVVNP